MKVLHLIYDHVSNPWVGGGAAVRVHELYRRLAARHDITVVCGKYPGAIDVVKDGVQYRFVGTKWRNYILSTFAYAACAALYGRKHSGEYDLVVEDFAPYNPAFSLFWHKRAVIQLHQCEGVRHLTRYWILGLPFYLVEKCYPRFFRYAFAELAASKELFGLKERVNILPNGFDPRLLELEAEEGGYLLFIGRFDIEQKGLDILGDAIEMVKCRLIMAGGGKDEAAVKSIFRSAVEAGSVEFVGYVWGSKKEELLRRCQFMVMPSRHEGQPLIMMDIAASGKPVIVSDIPVLQYVVEAGFGLSFKTGDAKDLGEKINLLLGDQPRRMAMGKAARAYAGNFSWDKIAEDYEQNLMDIAAQ